MVVRRYLIALVLAAAGCNHSAALHGGRDAGSPGAGNEGPQDAAIADGAAPPVGGSDAGPVDASSGDGGAAGVPYDTCAGPLDVSSGGAFTVDIGDAHGDYPGVLGPLFCGGVVGDSCRDIVATFHLDHAADVSIGADTGVGGYVAIALKSSCDGAGSSIDGAHGYGAVPLRRRALPAGTYFVFIGADPNDEVVIGGAPPAPLKNLTLNVAFAPASTAPANESCAAPLDLGAGGHFTGSFVDVTADVGACGARNSDLVYSFTTTARSNVHVVAQASPKALLDLTVRSSCGAGSYADCFLAEGSSTGPRPLERTFYDLDAGSYFLILEDWAHQEPDFTLDVDIAPGTPAPLGDTCASPIAVTPGVSYSGSLAAMQEDVYACGNRSIDAVHQFTIAQDSDVWIRAGGADPYVRVGLVSSCDGSSSSVAQCNDSGTGQAATYRRALAAGSYYVVVGSDFGASDYTLSVEAWPPSAVNPVSVSGNEGCATAFEVPPEGGVFVGDTTAAHDDTAPTACGAGTGGADVAFRWTTPVARRVLVTTAGSAFPATVELRDASCAELACDGNSGERGPAPAYPPTGALDLMLPAGSYVFVVDGWYAAAHGPYQFALRPL